MADRIDISAVARVLDQASAPLRAIQGAIKNVGNAAKTATGFMGRLGSISLGGLRSTLSGIGSAAGQMLARLTNFSGLRNAVGGVGQALGRLGGMFKWLLSPVGAFIGVTGVGGAVAAMREYISTTARMGRAADRLGISVEGLQSFRYLVGDTETADNALTKLQKTFTTIAAGGKPAAKLMPLFRKMGISLADIKAGNMDVILPKIAEGFAKNTNPTLRAAAALALFGKSGQQIIPFLARGSAGIEQAREAMKRYGLLTGEQVATAREAAAAIKEIGLLSSGTGKQIMAALLPALLPVIKGFRDWLAEMQPSIITGVSEAARILGEVLKTLWTGIQTVVTAMGGWQNVAIALAAVLSAQLVGPVLGLVGALANLGFQALLAAPALAGIAGAATAGAVAVYRNWDRIAPWFAQRLEAITGVSAKTWTDVGNQAVAAWGRIAKAFKTGGLAGGIIAAAQEIYNSWGAIWPFMETNFPRITDAAKAAWEGISTWATMSLQNIKRAWETGGLGAALEATWEAMRTGAVNAFNWVKNTLAAIPWADIGRSAKALFETAWMAASAIGQWIADQLRAIEWSAVGAFARDAFAAAWRAVLNLGQWLADQIRSAPWAEIGAAVGALFTNAWRLAVSLGQWLADQLRAIPWANVGKFAADTFMAVWQGALSLGRGLLEQVRAVKWEDAGRAAAALFTAAWQAAVKIGQGIIDALRGLRWREVGDFARDAFTTAWRAVAGFAQGFITELRAAEWSSTGAYAKSLFEGAWSGISGIVTWLSEQLRNAPWRELGTFAGNALTAAWKSAIDIVEWLGTLEWRQVGEDVGTALIEAIKTAFILLAKFDEWLQQVDWLKVGLAIFNGLVTAADVVLKAGLQLVEGLIDAMIKALPANLQRFLSALTAPLPDWARRALGIGVAAPARAAAEAIPPAAMEAAAEIPLPAPKPREPAAPPLGAAVAPTPGLTPGLVAQAVQAIPVRLDGTIEQRLKVDMSPDLRAMLSEQRAQIANLRVAQQTDIGRTMEPAAGIA